MKIIISCLFLTTGLAAAQDIQKKEITRLKKPIVSPVSAALFGDDKEATQKDQKEAAQKVVQSNSTAKGNEEKNEVSSLFPGLLELPPLPGTSQVEAETRKKKVNGKWVIAARNDSRPRLEVKVINGRKVIVPK